jgi:hypothetical protein
MDDTIYQKAYDWAYSYEFKERDVDYAARLALKMLDNSCAMSNEERKVFFYVYDAITDREDIKLEDEVNQLLRLARDRDTILSKPEFAPIVHACKMEIMQSTEKTFMKRFKNKVRKHLGMLQKDDEAA